MATDTFDPNSCPVGLTNSKDIEFLGERLNMAIEMLTAKVSDMKDDIETLSTTMNDKFDKMDARFDVMDIKIESFKNEMDLKMEALKNEMPQKIDDEVTRLKGKAATKAWVWVLCGVAGSAVVYVVSRWVASLFGL